MSAHITPGPWSLCYDGQIDGANGEFICSFNWDSVQEFNGDSEAKANARLIAAAPELLAALQAMLDAFHEDPSERDTSAVIEAAYAALAAARSQA